MNWKVKGLRNISGQVGSCGMSRAAVIRLLIKIQEYLTTVPDHIRDRRVPARPELFLWQTVVTENGERFLCRILVDDQSEPGTLKTVSFYGEQVK